MLSQGGSPAFHQTPGGAYNQQKMNLLTIASQKSAMLIAQNTHTKQLQAPSDYNTATPLNKRTIKTAGGIPLPYQGGRHTTQGIATSNNSVTDMRTTVTPGTASSTSVVKRRVGSMVNSNSSVTNDYKFLSPGQLSLGGFPTSSKGLTSQANFPEMQVSRNLVDPKFISSPTKGRL